MARAIVTSCEHRPNVAGLNILGHVGWGFEYPDGSWCVGAIEGPDWRQSNFNGFWARRVPGLRAALDYYASMAAQGAEYDCYKLFTVPAPQWQQADQAVAYVSRLKYELFGRNCMDSSYDVLRSFCGGIYQGGIIPRPQQHIIPNDWFNQFEYEEYRYLPGVTASSVIAMVEATPAEEEYRQRDNVATPHWRVPGNAEFIAPVVDEARYRQHVAVVPPKDRELSPAE